MEYSDKLINGGLHIKVNKKQKSINAPSRYMVNDIQSINDQFPPQRFSTSSIFSNIQKDKITNKNRFNNSTNNNNNFSQNGNAINFYTEGNNQLNSTNEELKYQKINISKRFNKNLNKNYSSIINSKYKKKYVDNDNGNKLYIYKSETQYPFCSKKEPVVESDNKSMKNISAGPDGKTMSLKHYKPNKKNNLEKTGIRNKNYFINDFDNNIPLKNDYNKSTEKNNNYSELTFNKLKQNFYKSYKKDKNNISNYANNTNNTNDNLQNYSKINSIIYNNKTEGYIKKSKIINIKNNYNNYENNNIKTESKDKKLLNIYKNKLINIFVRLMMNIFLKHKQKLFEDFLKGITDTINDNKIYKTKKINFQSNNPDDIEEDERINYYYIKKNKINVPENINNYNNNHNINLAKSISLNKNYSSMTMYKKAFRDKNYDIKNEKINRRIFINNKFKINIENDNNNNSIKRDSTKNIYIPAKSRYNGYNYISRQKDNIFNELKINKSTRIFERSPNLYQNQNINTQINNFYNTNNSNFYISKINPFNPIMNTENQKSKDFIFKNSQKNNQNLQSKQNYYKENNKVNVDVKCEIFKNRKRFPNVVYKKIFSTEKNSENNTESKNENENNSNVNIFMKRIERVYYKINKDKEDNINQTYSIRRKYKNMNKNMNMNNDMNKNQFATIVNYTTEGNDNNHNNIDVSNDINNYNLEDIDKPTNMMYVKHDNDNKFYNDNEEEVNNNDNNDSNDDIDIKNLLQMKTNDKRLFLNFNYITINKYDNNKNKNYKFKKNKFKYRITNPYSIYIPSPSYTNDDNNNLSTISNINKSFKETPEKINMNLNKYIKKRKIKSAILKLDNFMNDKIYGYKFIILKHLKSIKFKSIIYNIMKSHSLDILKKYFDIIKSNTILLKEENNILFEEADDKIGNKNIILDKKNINYIIDSNDFDDKSHQQSKEKLKYLVKQINNNDDEENNEILNTSFDQGDIFENNGNINAKIPLWKSVQNININNNKKIYMKKSVKNKSNKSKGNDNDYDINERKIEIFRNKLINFLFSKINK